MIRFASTVLAPGVAIALALSGCGRDRSHDNEPISVPVPARDASTAPTMRVVVSEVTADPTVDPQGVRSVFRDAETRLIECLDATGTAGIVAMSFPLEPDGSVGKVATGSNTTLKAPRALDCIEHRVAELRFQGTPGSRIVVSLEVRRRRAVE